MFRFARTVLAAGCVLLCVACSSGHSNTEPAQTPELSPAGNPGLPGLADLPAAERELSLTAPGFHVLDPLNPLASASSQELGGKLVLDNSGGSLTYAIYGVYGFDGDNYPVSVKLDTASSPTQFYIAFSDYTLGNWAMSGPYSGSGEFGIPALDEHSSPTAYTSPNHTHYFAVIVPDGSALTIDGLSLGVSGGSNAPVGVLLVTASGGDSGFMLSWIHSPSYTDPDFAGYIVERAPQFGGDFAGLSSSPSLNSYFLDLDSVPGMSYRFRVRTLDSSGNSALSPQFLAGPVVGGEANPVALSNLPDGPLYGPSELDIDLSSSFDPQGEGITTYKTDYFGTAPVSLNGVLNTVTLQPGCYWFHFNVECADGRTGDGYHLLKVYPRWQDLSVLVLPTTPLPTYKDSRLYLLRGALQPSDDRLTVAAMDYTLPGLSIWHHNGSELVEHRVKQIESVSGIGEAFQSGNSLVFPVSTKYGVYLAGFDGTQTELQYISSEGKTSALAASPDADGNVWFVYNQLDGLNHDLRISKAAGGFLPATLDTMMNSTVSIDMVFEPQSGHFFIFYIEAGDLICREWDPVSGTDLGNVTVDTGGATEPDAEINPQTGGIGVIYNINADMIYRERDGAGVWGGPILMDQTGANMDVSDLCASDSGELNAYFSYDGGQAHRYIFNGASWDLVNTISFSTESCHDCCLVPVAGSPDMRVADLCGDGMVRFARLNDNDTDNVFGSVNSALGQGFDMHAAAGTDGLHVIWDPVMTSPTVAHVFSVAGPDQGNLWLEKPGFDASSGLSLTGNLPGEIYASCYMNNKANLYYWDTAAGNFVPEASLDSQFDYRPILGNSLYTPAIVLCAWDDVAGMMHLISGSHGSFGADAPFDPLVSKVYDGAFSPYQPYLGLLIGSGTSPADPDQTFCDVLGSNSLDLNTTSLGSRASPFDKPSCAGHNYAAGVYFNELSLLDELRNVWLISSGSFVHPVRYDCGNSGPPKLSELPIGEFSIDLEARRTVSLAQVPGLCCATIVSTLGGEECLFQWSSYGDWETLPLPPGLDNMSCPLIIAGTDGRWHIIYRDWRTDSIMCRSTL